MPRGSVDMNFLFTLGELQRLVRALCRQAGRPLRHHPRAMGGAGQGRAHRGPETDGTRRTDGDAADHADAADRQALRQWLDRTPRRTNRPPRQPPLFCARPRGHCSAKLGGLRSEHHRDRAGGHQSRPMPTACSPNWNWSRKTFAMPSRTQPANLPEKSSAMADPVLKFPPNRRAARPLAGAAEDRRGAAPPADGRPAPLSPLPAAGGAAAGGGDRRPHLLSQRPAAT